MSKPARIGRCPIEYCQFTGKLTRHHIFPLRWRGRFRKEVHKDWIHHVEWLCRPCHDRLEKLIEGMERHEGDNKRVKLNWPKYPFIYREFALGRLA